MSTCSGPLLARHVKEERLAAEHVKVPLLRIQAHLLHH